MRGKAPQILIELRAARIAEQPQRHGAPGRRAIASAHARRARVQVDVGRPAQHQPWRQRLVDEIRSRTRAVWEARGARADQLDWIDHLFDPGALTIGFARRVPSYKRLTLILRERERLTRLLLDPRHPVQLVVAGKAHPADEGGKHLIQELAAFAADVEVRHRIVFLPDYDMAMARTLVSGVDVWLNNPLRPFEACGTSGMKAALNGGLNLSILDGWWDEWFDGQNGWAIPTADGVADPDRRDDLEAAALYDLIENSVAPHFYDRDANGLPPHWLSMVSHTFATLSPKVLASRMVRDYTEKLYGPAARAGIALDGKGWRGAKALAAYKAKVRAAWPSVRVDHVESSGVSDSPQIGDVLEVHAYIDLDGLTADDVEVQFVHGRITESDVMWDTQSLPLQLGESFEGSRHRFDGTLRLGRTGSFGYTVRVLPKHPALVGGVELGLVTNA